MTIETCDNRVEAGEVAKARFLTLRPEDVSLAYSGKPGCGCGCRGIYRVNPAFLAVEEKRRGYPYDANEVGLGLVARLLRAAQKRIQGGEELIVQVDENDGFRMIYVVESETRYHWIYLR